VIRLRGAAGHAGRAYARRSSVRSVEARPAGERLIFVSPWLWAMALVLGLFGCLGVGLAAGYGGPELAQRLTGLGVLAVVGCLGSYDLTARVVIADSTGFHALLRRRVGWNSVQWAELVEFVPGFIPNVTVRVVGKELDPKTGALRGYTLAGLAGFTASRRHRRIVAQFNDWIAAADPDWVINPWLHRSDRPDNR
jgi:hypothetical protein